MGAMCAPSSTGRQAASRPAPGKVLVPVTRATVRRSWCFRCAASDVKSVIGLAAVTLAAGSIPRS